MSELIPKAKVYLKGSNMEIKTLNNKALAKVLICKIKYKHNAL
jgi:hypothetical protein